MYITVATWHVVCVQYHWTYVLETTVDGRTAQHVVTTLVVCTDVWRSSCMVTWGMWSNSTPASTHFLLRCTCCSNMLPFSLTNWFMYRNSVTCSVMLLLFTWRSPKDKKRFQLVRDRRAVYCYHKYTMLWIPSEHFMKPFTQVKIGHQLLVSFISFCRATGLLWATPMQHYRNCGVT